MRNHFLWISWLVFGLLVGCKSGGEPAGTSAGESVPGPESVAAEEPAGAPEAAGAVVAPAVGPDLGWMAGTWKQEEEGGRVSYEVWEQAARDHLVGHAYTLVGTDTVFVEDLEIRVAEDTLTYFANVRENGGPVPFRLLESDSYTATFWNPAYDFPWKIVYRRTADALDIRIAGFVEGEAIVRDLHMVRGE